MCMQRTAADLASHPCRYLPRMCVLCASLQSAHRAHEEARVRRQLLLHHAEDDTHRPYVVIGDTQMVVDAKLELFKNELD
jgi:hypothetical protein